MEKINIKKDGEFITSEEMDKVLDKPEHWWTEAYYWLYRFWNKILYIPKNIQHFIQRGKRGWADCDVWSLDYYLAKVISQTVRRLEKDHHGYPGVPFGHLLFDDDSAEDKKWTQTLVTIAEGFEMMLSLDDLVWDKERPIEEYIQKEKDIKTVAKGKMKLLIDHFEHLWD